MNLSRKTTLAAAALLSSCSSVSSNFPVMDEALSGLPSFDLFSGEPPPGTLTIESAPPGAVARTSNGAACRTPCSVAVPLSGDFSVTYSLDGYISQAVPVRVIPVEKSALIDRTPPRLQPNRVFVELQPEPPPPPPPPKKRSRG